MSLLITLARQPEGFCAILIYGFSLQHWESIVDHVDGFLIMYSVTSIQSAINARNVIDGIRKSKIPSIKNIPLLLVGNKAELQHARKVPTEDCENFAQKYGVGFRECSVACMMNVDGIIKPLIKQIQETNSQQGGGKLTRKPSNSGKKTIMKNFLSKKKEK